MQSLCERLHQRGAHVSVYREDAAAGPATPVLLEVVLDGPPPACRAVHAWSPVLKAECGRNGRTTGGR